MSSYIPSPLSQKYIDIVEKIKAYTFQTPSNRGIADPSYKSYLARCSILFKLDMRLNDLCNTYDFYDPDDQASIEEALLEIEQEVDKLTELR